MMEIEKPKILLEEQDNGARALITVEPLEKGFGIDSLKNIRLWILSSEEDGAEQLPVDSGNKDAYTGL